MCTLRFLLLLLILIFLDNDDVIGSNQCRCLPKAELNTKNSTKRQLSCRLVEFLVFNGLRQTQAPIITTNDFTIIQQAAGLGDTISINQLSVSAEGQVEHQKLNQTASLLSFG